MRREQLPVARTSAVMREAASLLLGLVPDEYARTVAHELRARAVLLENAAENAETNDSPVYEACLREVWEIRS